MIFEIKIPFISFESLKIKRFFDTWKLFLRIYDIMPTRFKFIAVKFYLQTKQGWMCRKPFYIIHIIVCVFKWVKRRDSRCFLIIYYKRCFFFKKKRMFINLVNICYKNIHFSTRKIVIECNEVELPVILKKLQKRACRATP